MKIMVVAGARPNFMKAAPLILAAEEAGIEALLVHTGQHYDDAMSRVFFDELGLPRPRRHLGVGSGSHAEVTGRCLMACEEVFTEEHPDRVLVVGDVNSTAAAALAAVKLHLPVDHVEAGLRSFDRTMPEEINRVVTDAICSLLFVTEQAGVENLRAEGRRAQDIHLVGNVMIDTLERFLPLARGRNTAASMDLEPGSYALVTLHRPSNVDRAQDLDRLAGRLVRVAGRLPFVFPIHPRTRTRLEQSGTWKELTSLAGVRLVEPLGYLDFVSLMTDARVVLTDSGGIQEETTVLGVPCLTLRDNTERPVTVEHGTNRLVGARGDRLPDALDDVLASPAPGPRRPPLWDGRAAGRIMEILRAAA